MKPDVSGVKWEKPSAGLDGRRHKWEIGGRKTEEGFNCRDKMEENRSEGLNGSTEVSDLMGKDK